VDSPRSTITTTTAAAAAFLKEQRLEEMELDTVKHESSATFENYAEWLPRLAEKIMGLCENLEMEKDEEDNSVGNMETNSRVATPLALLVVELESLLSNLDHIYQNGQTTNSSSGQFLKGWVVNMLLSMKIRLSSVVQAYVSILDSRAKGFGPERVVKLLQSFSYVLNTWLTRCLQLSSGSIDSKDVDAEAWTRDLHDLRATVRSKELDAWVDLLRYYISDLGGRQHLTASCQVTLSEVTAEYKHLIQKLDAFQ
jgi:hypothetical protein